MCGILWQVIGLHICYDQQTELNQIRIITTVRPHQAGAILMIETYLQLMIHKPQRWGEMPGVATRGPMSSRPRIVCPYFLLSASRWAREVSRRNSGRLL